VRLEDRIAWIAFKVLPPVFGVLPLWPHASTLCGPMFKFEGGSAKWWIPFVPKASLKIRVFLDRVYRLGGS